MSVKLTLFGAAGEVTGSCTLVETGAARLLVDFGLHQGGAVVQARNRRMPPVEPPRLDAVILTHAHIDHCGRLPLLVKPVAQGGGGFTGPIWCTPATAELVSILLKDSAHLQQMDAERQTRGRMRRGNAPVAPLYTLDDVARVLQLLRSLDYERMQEVAMGVSIRFVDAGHILGSASVEMRIKPPGGSERVVVFSGDIGVKGVPLLRDPVMFEAADVVILESTYGDRDHVPLLETVEAFARVMRDAAVSGGKIIIPAFAVGRTQQLIYTIGDLKREGRIDRTPVYVDSPMAIETTELYKRRRECFDEPALALIDKDIAPLHFPGLQFTRTGEESRRLNHLDSAAVIIAASGMCTGGRVVHHLLHNLWKPGTHVVIAGFQARGTLGRELVDRARRVVIMNHPVVVKAQVHTLNGFSAHAGQSELVDWIRPMAGGKPRVVLNHGEAGPREALRAMLAARFALSPVCPLWGESVTLD